MTSLLVPARGASLIVDQLRVAVTGATALSQRSGRIAGSLAAPLGSN